MERWGQKDDKVQTNVNKVKQTGSNSPVDRDVEGTHKQHRWGRNNTEKQREKNTDQIRESDM